MDGDAPVLLCKVDFGWAKCLPLRPRMTQPIQVQEFLVYCVMAQYNNLASLSLSLFSFSISFTSKEHTSTYLFSEVLLYKQSTPPLLVVIILLFLSLISN